jgi:hypothetical protein
MVMAEYVDKNKALVQTVDIVKECARAGNFGDIPKLLQDIYDKLVELNTDVAATNR